MCHRDNEQAAKSNCQQFHFRLCIILERFKSF